MTESNRSTPDDAPTCGKGLAEHARVPATLASLTDAVADVLEHHMTALDLGDERSRTEHDAYDRLVAQHRKTAAALRATADEMAGYRSLPMGRHDVALMMDPASREVFARLIEAEEALWTMLRKRLEGDRAMLRRMGGAPA